MVNFMCQLAWTMMPRYCGVPQSCPTLWDPMGCSSPGSSVHGILQARTLEWVAISFSNAWKWKVKVKSLTCVWLVVTPWTTMQSTRLLCPWDCPGKSTGVGCHCLLCFLRQWFSNLRVCLWDSPAEMVTLQIWLGLTLNVWLNSCEDTQESACRRRFWCPMVCSPLWEILLMWGWQFSWQFTDIYRRKARDSDGESEGAKGREPFCSLNLWPTVLSLETQCQPSTWAQTAPFTVILKCCETSLVVQWLRILLPMQETRVWSLVGEPRAHIP